MLIKNPIVVFAMLAAAAAAGVAGLTRESWMGGTPPVETATPEAPATAEQPAQPEAPKVIEQTAATEAPAPAEQVASTEPAETSEQPAETVGEQPVATPEVTEPAEQAAVTPEEPAATPEPTQPVQQVAVAPEEPATTPEATQPAAPEAEPVVPAFDTVRVEKTGEAVIAGTAAPGAEVVLRLNGTSIATTTANDGGAFVIVLDKPLPPGSGTLTLEAKAPGDIVFTPSAQSVAVFVPEGAGQGALVAVFSPDQPTRILQRLALPPPEPAAAPAPEPQAETAEVPEAPAKPARLVSIDAVDYDASGNIVFSGQGEPGNTARIYIDNQFIGDATVTADGRWSFSGTADVAQGVHTLRVDGLDAQGAVINRVEVPFFREAQSSVAQVAPEAQPAAAPAVAEAPKVDAETAAPPPPREGKVVIQPGNNLWRISRVLYGTGAKYTMLYNANKDQIRNPNLVYPGQVFKTPDVASRLETIDPKRREPLKPDESAASGQ